MSNLSHWGTIPDIVPIGMTPPLHVAGEDKNRVFAYDLYEAIYWTAPESFQLAMRGQEGKPLYIPSGRKIVDTAHRYMAPKMQIITDPAFGTDGEKSEASAFMADFVKREKFYSKFSAAKLNGIMRGDWIFHLIADPDRPEGARVSLFSEHPSMYFPLFDEDDPTSLIAVKLVESALKPDGQPAVNVLEYRKVSGMGGPSPIEVTAIMYEPDAWGQPETDMGLKAIKEMAPPMTLPDPIDQIPVYHIPNMYETDFTWGSSEMRGVERLMRGINQAITDEEIALVLEGLGVYVTDAGGPIDEETEEDVPWTIAPGRVIETPKGSIFTRVQGINSVTPYMDHLNYLHGQLESTMGQNDITNGRVDVSVAESGIALTLRMAPLLSRMEEKELIITDVVNHMLYDLRRWFTAYEPLDFENIRWSPVYGAKLPENKQQKFSDIMQMYTAIPPLVSGEEARKMMMELGWSFTDEATLKAQINSDQANVLDAQAARILGGASGTG